MTQYTIIPTSIKLLSRFLGFHNSEFVALCLIHGLSLLSWWLWWLRQLYEHQLLPSGSSSQGYWRQQIIKHFCMIIWFIPKMSSIIATFHYSISIALSAKSMVNSLFWLNQREPERPDIRTGRSHGDTAHHCGVHEKWITY